jgi:hypothetical protein
MVVNLTHSRLYRVLGAAGLSRKQAIVMSLFNHKSFNRALPLSAALMVSIYVLLQCFYDGGWQLLISICAFYVCLVALLVYLNKRG